MARLNQFERRCRPIVSECYVRLRCRSYRNTRRYITCVESNEVGDIRMPGMLKVQPAIGLASQSEIYKERLKFQ